VSRTSFQEFYDVHKHHLIPFSMMSKKKIFEEQMSKIIEEQMLQQQIQPKIPACPLYKYCTSNVHHPQKCHDVMQRYYGHVYRCCQYFICPTCQNVSNEEYNKFYEIHKEHLCDFINKSKKVIFRSKQEQHQESVAALVDLTQTVQSRQHTALKRKQSNAFLTEHSHNLTWEERTYCIKTETTKCIRCSKNKKSKTEGSTDCIEQENTQIYHKSRKSK